MLALGRSSFARLLLIAGLLVTTVVSTMGTALASKQQSAARAAEIAATEVVGWGSNTYSQLGNSSPPDLSTPVSVAADFGGKEISAVTGGSIYSCAIAGGKAYCWGTGPLGNGGDGFSRVPVPVSTAGVLAGKTVTAIDAGVNSTCVIADGSAYCWGSNIEGILGTNARDDAFVPVAVDVSGVLKGKTVTSISVGTSNDACLVADGRVYCWGSNTNGALGIGDQGGWASLTPIAVDFSGVLQDKTVTAVSVGAYQSCVIADGAPYCWGDGSRGNVGDGGPATHRWVPYAVDTNGALKGKIVTAISVGEDHTCVIADGRGYCWGVGEYGQLGVGNDDDHNSPVAVSTDGIPVGVQLTSIVADPRSCAVGGGNAYCWGGGLDAPKMPVAVPKTGPLATKQVIAVAGGREHTLAIVGQSDTTTNPSTTPPALPPIPASSAGHNPIGFLDSSILTGSSFHMTGWAADPDAPGSPVQIRVRDGRPDGSQVVSMATADRARPDVGRAFPWAGGVHGFEESTRLTPGHHEICLTAVNMGTSGSNTSFGCRSAEVSGPIGSLDSVGQVQQSSVLVSGWAADPDMPGLAEDVVVTVSGPSGTVDFPGARTGQARPDVQAVYPWAGGRTGFSASVPVQGVGKHTVCVRAINIREPKTNPQLGCRSVTVQNAFGIIDSISVKGTLVTVSGWALNPNAPHDPVGMYWYPARASSAFNGGLPEAADKYRPDVGAVYPGYGTNHGFEMSINAPAGTYAVCVGAFTDKGGSANTVLGCRTITVNHIFGNLDSLTVAGRTISATGWALDPNSKDQRVQVYLTVMTSSGVPRVPANTYRPDVAAAFRGYDEHHGFDLTMDTDPGVYRSCVWVQDLPIDRELGCQNIVVE